tara:strand:+ start:198 stop:428 length:231 start_codon:yes stop_codon:yes gene_type:complete
MTGRKIDWEENDPSKISMKQADMVQKILTAEASIHVLRRVTGLCGSLADDMANSRRKLINEYEAEFEPYVNERDFY